MITDAIIGVALAVWNGFVSLIAAIPVPDPDSTTASLFGDLSVIAGHMAALGYWIPWDVAGAVIVALWGVFLAVIAIRVVRMVVSLLTGGGGA